MPSWNAVEWSRDITELAAFCFGGVFWFNVSCVPTISPKTMLHIWLISLNAIWCKVISDWRWLFFLGGGEVVSFFAVAATSPKIVTLNFDDSWLDSKSRFSLGTQWSSLVFILFSNKFFIPTSFFPFFCCFGFSSCVGWLPAITFPRPLCAGMASLNPLALRIVRGPTWNYF